MNDSQKELEINKKNREEYEELLMGSSAHLDGAWGMYNTFVKLLLLILGIIIVVGVIFFLYQYSNI